MTADQAAGREPSSPSAAASASGGTGAAQPLPHRETVDDEVIRQSADAIIVTDATFAIRTWNPAAERIYGIPAELAIGERLRSIVDALELSGGPFDAKAAEASLASTGTWRSRLIHRPLVGSRPGRDVIVDSSVVVLRDAAGTVTGAIGMNRDVTASASLESEIAALGSLVVATGHARTKAEVALASLEILCRATGADAGLVTSMDSTYEATAHLGVNQHTIDVILAYGQLGGPLARALEAPDAYVTADVATAPLREDVREAVLADGIHHLIVVGLRLSGRLTGILSIGWRRTAPVEPSQAVMLQAAALIASSIENARLLDAVESGLAEERTLTRRMRALVELTQLPETTSRADFDTSQLLAELRGVVGARAVLYARVEGDRLVLTNVDAPEWEAARPFVDRPLSAFPMTASLRNGANALLFPVGGEMTSEEGGAAIAAAGFQTIAIFPLREAETLVGVVFVGFGRPMEEVELDERTLESIGRVLDISFANRRLREVVSASERRYRELFESTPEALVVENRESVVVDANAAAFRLFGEDLLGRPVDELVVGEPAFLDLEGERAPLNRTGVGRRIDGSTFPEEVELRALDIAGEPHTLAIVRDLTEQVRMQSELVQAQKMEAIGLLVAGVAHELNNPLASIVAFSQLIRTDPTLPGDLRTQADLLVQEANRTRVIVQNLLDFARQRPPERVRAELRPIVESVLGLQSYVLSRNHVTVDVAIPDDLPALLVDRGQLQQVLINLTFNSAQAIHDAGRPGTIRVAAEARTGEDGSRQVRLTVEDDGPGVPAAVADRLFMPFVTTKAPGEGTGLGLSVSFGIVAGHGGTLRHEPRPGGGARFVIELPVEPAQPVAGDDPATAPPAGAGPEAGPPSAGTGGAAGEGRIRILVLDDEPSIREFLARVLTRYGYEPVLASTGAAALDIVRRDPPAAILCDHRMAGMSGTEFHDAVQAIEPALARRFAFMSGDVLNPELREFAGTRGVHLLAKPFDLATVDALIGTLLSEADEPA